MAITLADGPGFGKLVLIAEAGRAMAERGEYLVSMNGESSTEAPRRRPVHENHYCMHEGCKRWGGFGFDMRFGTEWYCAEHRPTDYQRI